MARAGLISKNLANIDPSTCPGCAYGKSHRKPRIQKGIRNRKTLGLATRPSQVVSVDQLIIPTSVFIQTHHGTPSTKRYSGATVFVYHLSDFTYVHLMRGNTSADTRVESKLASERVCQSHSV